MKTVLATTAAILAFTVPTRAASVSELDTNGDGMVTNDELKIVNPEITDETFAAMDTNGGGSLDDEELSAADQ
ncbi:hypothetical protein [Falsihalocynthiibacter arcticus]|uniref:EF-hand domain-containing protein n=1 Tax=Falsihalocynthiibacter arcticus TaxID=1579316 RepID=A0A126V015_9RHOB|nr:hypothetical protein [Falsihalocynthiibacter arcticus]AML51630.1 hypothetical protein RC74_10470 [Falsihalocynthiibacter arcticus]